MSLLYTYILHSDICRLAVRFLVVNGDFDCKFPLCLAPVAPSRPVCGIQGTAEYWDNISLSCMSEEGSPSPTYKWKSYSVLNAPRPLPPRANESRPFICIHCNILLHVPAVFESQLEMGAQKACVVLTVMLAPHSFL